MQDDILKIRADALRLDIPREGYRAYMDQRRSAKRRGIPFLMTLPEWWTWWQANGWINRGRSKGKNVMARRGDVGPYILDNIYVTTLEGNIADARPDPDAWGDVPTPGVIRYPW